MENNDQPPLSSFMTGTPSPSTSGAGSLPPLSSFMNSNAGANANADTTTQPVDSRGAIFPASTDDSIFGGIGKLIGNIPSSALGFVKGAIGFLNPVNTVKTVSQIPAEFQSLVQESGGVKNAVEGVAKEILPSAYGLLVPKAAQQVIAGDYAGARQTLDNDPVGQVLPFILLARGAAEKAGYGEQFDNTISKVASPVTDSASYVGGKIANAAGSAASQVLGAATGAGASSIEEAANHSQAFLDAMRGKTNPDDVVQTAQDAVQSIVNNRRADYVAKLKDIGDNQTSSLDISPVVKTLQSQLDNFGVKISDDGTLDFSRSTIANNGSARADIQGVYDTLKDWGSQEGDRTPLGLDTLKKQLGDFYTTSGSARAFVQAVKSQVTGILNDQVPGYKDMTSSYQEASSLLDDIKSATGAGGKSKVDTVFTKLTSAMKGDKQLRLEVLDQMQSQGAQPDLMAKIAGMNMQSFIPKGIVGKSIDVTSAFGLLTHFFNPEMIPALLSTSPRIVGEFVSALGYGADKTSTIMGAINNLPNTLLNKK